MVQITFISFCIDKNLLPTKAEWLYFEVYKPDLCVLNLVMKPKCQNVEMCVRLLHPLTLTSKVVYEFVTDGETESIIREFYYKQTKR